MTNKLALIVAVVLGVLSILGIKAYVERVQQDLMYTTEMMTVMVAARDIPPGTIFTDDDIETNQFPRDVLRNALRDTWETNRDAIIGARTKTRVKAGQILLTAHFHTKIEGKRINFGKDQRAMTIPINRVAGLSGMLRPGDNIDLATNLNIKDPSGKTYPVARTLFQNVRILATDSNTDPYGLAGESYSTLTLALTPRDCNKLLWVINNGGQIHCLLTQPGTPPSNSNEPIIADVLYREIAAELRRQQ